MTQGVAYSRRGMAGEPGFNSAGFRDDVRAFFGSGTGPQELYIQPDKLTPEDWRVLAEAATWSLLVDTHWFGGDPGQSQPYGYASWTPGKGILMLRNPDDRTRQLAFDIGAVFELPPGGKKSYRLKSPWGGNATDTPTKATAGKPVTLKAQPFEVIVLETLDSPK